MWSRFFIIITAYLLWSCQTSQPAITSKGQNGFLTPNSMSQYMDTQTFNGKFKSTQGIKTELSCYCNNGGYLETEAGETIAICLDAINAKASCEAMEVKGGYINKSNNPEPSNPCSKGEMKFFQVSSYQCR